MEQQGTYDAVIIGARVAGAALATLLGDAGHRVVLVERAAFPSSTLSTHFFRGGRAVGVLQRLGVLEEVLAHGSPPLIRQFGYPGGGGEAVEQPPQAPGEIGYCLSVRRAPLDAILARRAAQSSSVEVLEQARATALLRDGERVVGVRLATAAGEREVRARIVVGADGRHSFVARAVAAPIQEEETAHRGMYYCYVRDFPGPGGAAPDGPEFSLLGDEVAYLFPSDDGVACIALSLNLADYGWVRQDPEDRFRERIARHAGFANRFAAAPWEGRLLGCGPEGNYVRVPGGPGWALVGDAGLHQDPWTGLGIDNAMVHATFLAEALAGWFAGQAGEDEALAQYHRRRDDDALAGYRMTVAMSRDLSQPPPARNEEVAE